MEKKTSLYPFIQKLYTMLSNNDNAAYIAWNEPGDQFTVYNPAEFSSQLLPQQFKHNNFCSFIRQLNIYGFHKVESDNWVFTHEDGNFQRGRLDLLAKITRRKQQKRSAPSDTSIDQDKPAKVAKTSSESTPGTPLPFPMTPNSNATLSPLPTTPQSFPTQTFSPPMSLPSMVSPPVATSPLLFPSQHSPAPQQADMLVKMNESIVGELASMRRKSQTQENTIAWLIQELLKSKKEIEELKRSVKTIQANAEETQRKQVLDLVQDQQQHQRQLHLQLQQQLEAQPSLLTIPQYPVIKSERPSALDQLQAQHQIMQQRTAHADTLLAQSFDLNLYLMQNAGGDGASPESSSLSSDNDLSVLDNVYDGPDWIQMSQSHQQ